LLELPDLATNTHSAPVRDSTAMKAKIIEDLVPGIAVFRLCGAFPAVLSPSPENPLMLLS
jgi:hypothetical protein